jgi:hypothetical protein
MLRNTAVERKEGDRIMLLYDPEVLAMARGLFPPGKEYQFDLVATTTLGTTAGGVLNQTIAFSPAVTTYNEYASLAALFDEVVLRRAALQFLPTVGSNGTVLTAAGGAQVIINGVACGYNSDNISTSPASYAAVVRLAKSANIARCIADHSGVTTMKVVIVRNRPWASTSTPAVASPPAGCVGTFDVANAINMSNSTTYYVATLRSTMRFRMRI